MELTINKLKGTVVVFVVLASFRNALDVVASLPTETGSNKVNDISEIIDLDDDTQSRATKDAQSVNRNVVIDTSDSHLLLPVPVETYNDTFPLSVHDEDSEDDEDDVLSGSGSGEGLETNNTTSEILTDIIATDADASIIITTGPQSVANEIPDVACDKTTCKFGGRCKDKAMCICDLRCGSRSSAPVCGSDGKTYRNRCQLKQESCWQQRNITAVKQMPCSESTEGGGPQICTEMAEPKWSHWSAWFQSGDNSYRFRFCDVSSMQSDQEMTCNGPNVETRPCKRHDVKKCTSPMGYPTEEYKYNCEGLDIGDVMATDDVFDASHREADCRYSLYDMEGNHFVFSNWNYTRLLLEGDTIVWCNHKRTFIPFHTPMHICQVSLQKFCQEAAICNYPNKRQKRKNRGDIGGKCLKKFVFGGNIPNGFPQAEFGYFICQRFSDDSMYSPWFDEKQSYFGTLYDTNLRLPIWSAAKVTDIGEPNWPAVPYMIERGLLKDEGGFTFWLRKTNRKGMVPLSDVKSCDEKSEKSLCRFGENQALESDYKSSGYRITQLMWPDIIGSDVTKMISTFTMTNTAPMHPSLYASWKKALHSVRLHALGKCGIPYLNETTTQKRRGAHNFPALYTVSGVVPSSKPEETIGNDVNVPYLFWYATCCVRGADTTSYSLYARNVHDSSVVVAPIMQLEVLLTDLYGIKPNKTGITLFPAYDGICSNTKHDVSEEIEI